MKVDFVQFPHGSALYCHTALLKNPRIPPTIRSSILINPCESITRAGRNWL
jgi:hypothetical protein